MTQDKIYKLEDNPYSHFTICDNSGNENEKRFFFKNSCSVFEK